jgi:hypothetical protein
VTFDEGLVLAAKTLCAAAVVAVVSIGLGALIACFVRLGNRRR